MGSERACMGTQQPCQPGIIFALSQGSGLVQAGGILVRKCQGVDGRRRPLLDCSRRMEGMQPA